MKTLTLQQLSEKLHGKYWEKGEKKRVYLDRGHNTKKMSTTTYVYQREDGSFGVSCFIDCPSQPYQWIDSQKDEIIENVEEEIQKVFRDIEFDAADELFVVYNPSAGEGTYYSRYNESKFNDLGDLYENEDVFLSEKEAEQVIKSHDLSNDWIVISVKKSLYKERYEMRLAEIRLEREQKQEDAKIKAEAERKQKSQEEKELRDKSTDVALNMEGEKVKHPRFGVGIVLSRGDGKVTVNFPEIGEKQLLEKFAKLEVAHG